jgi:hypothetical protein
MKVLSLTIAVSCLVLSLSLVTGLHSASGASPALIAATVTAPPQSCPAGYKLTPTAASGSSMSHPLYAFICSTEKIACPANYELVPRSALYDPSRDDFRFTCTQPYRRY